MRFRDQATAFVVLMLLLIPAAVAAGADQIVEVSVLPADTLSIDVEGEFGLDAVVPGGTTPERVFWMGITNTTSGGWEVTVDGTDLQSFTLECDEWGENCQRTLTDPLSTIDASNLYLRGGDQDNWGDETAIVAYEGNLGAPLLLMEGTAVANGSFGIDNPQPSVQLTVPGDATFGDYYTTLTYTIMAPTP